MYGVRRILNGVCCTLYAGAVGPSGTNAPVRRTTRRARYCGASGCTPPRRRCSARTRVGEEVALYGRVRLIERVPPDLRLLMRVRARARVGAPPATTCNEWCGAVRRGASQYDVVQCSTTWCNAVAHDLRVGAPPLPATMGRPAAEQPDRPAHRPVPVRACVCACTCMCVGVCAAGDTCRGTHAHIIRGHRLEVLRVCRRSWVLALEEDFRLGAASLDSRYVGHRLYLLHERPRGWPVPGTPIQRGNIGRPVAA
jgi:hypothetical protein